MIFVGLNVVVIFSFYIAFIYSILIQILICNTNYMFEHVCRQWHRSQTQTIYCIKHTYMFIANITLQKVYMK